MVRAEWEPMKISVCHRANLLSNPNGSEIACGECGAILGTEDIIEAGLTCDNCKLTKSIANFYNKKGVWSSTCQDCKNGLIKIDVADTVPTNDSVPDLGVHVHEPIEIQDRIS